MDDRDEEDGYITGLKVKTCIKDHVLRMKKKKLWKFEGNT
jgi:hypothetical protein